MSNKENQFIKSMKDINLEDRVRIRFQDGLASAKIESKDRRTLVFGDATKRF